jgi:cell division protein ZapE
LSVIEFARQEIARRGYVTDVAQHAALDRLQRCYDEWRAICARDANSVWRLVAFFRPIEPPQGVYLWGGAGRGKTFLMDCFYACAPPKRKVRVHFHRFMYDVHLQLNALKGVADPLNTLAQRIAYHARLICFDEFHLCDIADAMILYRLLDALFKNGVQFLMTSNYQPDALYPGGLHRERILPAIALIKQKLDVVQVDGGTDYRQRMLGTMRAYHTPLGEAAERALHGAFTALAATTTEAPVLEIAGRTLRAQRSAEGIVWFDFAVLCGSARSQNDYLDIARRFHWVILSNVPQMTPRMAAAARRLTWLIDILYDHKIKLLLSAAAPPENLYPAGPMAGEFVRTASRLFEMQSQTYLATIPERASASARVLSG